MKKKKRKKSNLFYLVWLLVLSGIFLVSGFVVYIFNDIPSVKVLKNLKNKPVTSVYDANDQLIYLFVPDNRVFVAYNRIPKHVRNPFIAAEDAEFFEHGGVDPISIIRAFVKDLAYGRLAQGGSTITQQVVKSLLLGPEKNLIRKVREVILAYRLENSLTKHEILNLYLNNIYMGHGIYGVEAASQVYFGKHVWNITPAEAALLAGLVQAPSRYTPKKHPGSARARQEYVIHQLQDKKFIDSKTSLSMLAEKIQIRESDGVFADTYYKDYIFKYVEDKYGEGVTSKRGLKIYAAVDTQFQRAGENAVKRGLLLYSQRKGAYEAGQHLNRFRWDDFVKSEQKDIEFTGLRSGNTYRVLITEQLKEGYSIFAGKQKGILKMDTFPFKPGDVVKASYSGINKKKNHMFEPVRSLNVEGALVCMDVQTGYVYAMVGGKDFESSPYNRAVSARVQSGSAFKPFIYVTALKKGYEPDTLIPDEPKQYSSGLGRTWTPRNYDGVYAGQISMQDAIAYSKNAATVRLLEEVGIAAVKDTVRDLGIEANLENNLSIALGTSGLTLLDVVKGFSAFANGGSRIKPLFIRKITDADGNVLEENGIQKERVLPEEIAAKMNMLLKGPTDYGTAKGIAARLGYPVAGKTGTTNNYNDALFVGYSPHIAAGVWVGFDARASLGQGESGAKVCLPIWMSFMGSALKRYAPDDFAPVETNPFDMILQHFR